MAGRQICVTMCVLLVMGTLLKADNKKETLEEQARRIHQSAVICDLHADSFTVVHLKKADFIKGSSLLQIDVPKLRAGNVALTSQAIWVLNKGLTTTPLKYVLSALDTFDKTMKEGASHLQLVRGYKEFLEARQNGKIAVVLTIENGSAIMGKIEILRMFYERGVRGMSLTWNKNNEIGTSAWEARHKKGIGLSKFGREAVSEMERLGMMIDISHASSQTVKDVLDTVKAPIYASHSCAYGVCPHWRNIGERQVKAIAERGGVIGVNFYSAHLRKDRKRASAKDIADHIDYLVKIGGVDVVAIGSDYDGDIGVPKGIDNISKLEVLTLELLKRGYSEEDIKKILGGNFLRFFREVCP